MTDPMKTTESPATGLARELEELSNVRLSAERNLKRATWSVLIVSVSFAAISTLSVFLAPDSNAGIYFVAWLLFLTSALLSVIKILQTTGESSRQELEILRRIASDKEST